MQTKGPKRKNPPRAARPGDKRGDSADRSVRGRAAARVSGRGSSKAAGDGEPGVRPPLSSMGRACRPRLHSSVVAGNQLPSPDDVLGRAIDPRFGSISPLRIGVSTANRVLTQHSQFCPQMRNPGSSGAYSVPLFVDYNKRVEDLKIQRSENPYQFVKDPSVEERFWSRFHSDYYFTVLYKHGRSGSKAPIFQHKCLLLSSLKAHDHPEMTQLLSDLDDWRLLTLMTFQHSWNEEIICQFWATLWIDSEHKVLHWMTASEHFHCDYTTFSRLLGFNHVDRAAPSLCSLYPDSVPQDHLAAAQIYLPGFPADCTTAALKPYFYVLNNLIRWSVDPKIGDSIRIHHDAPKILVRFGVNGGRFSISDFMWTKIAEASVNPHKSLPYAPYIMHIIEQVVGHRFYHDCPHSLYSVRHLGPPGGPPALPACGDAPASGNALASGGTSSPPRSSSERRGCGGGHHSRGGGAIKFALRKLHEFLCYKAERDDRRLTRLEQQYNIEPPSPLREFRDPFDEYAEVCAAAGAEEAGPSSDPHGKRGTTNNGDYSSESDDDDDY